MIDYIRFALYGVLVVVLLMLYQNWEKEHSAKTTPLSHPDTTASNYVPDVKETTAPTTSIAGNHTPAPVIQHGPLIKVTTDVLAVDIDSVGGNILAVKLLKYPEKQNTNTPFLLLNNDPATRYVAQSGLLSTIGPDTSKGQATFVPDKTDYVLSPDQKELNVKLHWQNTDGLKVTKTFTFLRDSYDIGVNYQINNDSKLPWEGNLYLQLLRKDVPPPSSQGFSNLTTYFGAAVSSPDKPFQKISFSDMAKRNFNQTITDGWAAMIQHYFVSAWIPDKTTTSQYFSRLTPDGLYSVGMIGPKLTVPTGSSTSASAHFYAGPAISDMLEKAAPNLKLTIDYGWFWFISVIIFWMMQKIYNFVGNWGWSIVIVTIIIKLLFYHLSAKSYRSMSMLKKLQPKLEELKTRYGEDKQKFTQATMELYRKEKVNPMSGCLPILIQIPVFIALYWVLVEAVQLRHAPFILWIHDLSTKDPYYVLPLLVGGSMLLQQLISPPPPDPTQAKVMLLMPVIFTVLFINFPAGLMLYWFVNNTLSMLQQWYIMRTVENETKVKKVK